MAMRLEGRAIADGRTAWAMTVADTCGPRAGFAERLECCLLALCKGADIPAPIWLSRNTGELARVGKTSFFAEQFAEPVRFDSFEIRLQ